MQAAVTVSPVRSRLPAAVTAVSLAGAPAVLAVLGWQRRWVAEDGFITLRVVRQLEAGHGPVFNAGERVEASTSVLWTVLLAVVHQVIRVRLEVLAVGLGLALS
ncbi:MAG TPA: arabinosyltransferase, partial [Acidimicrobiia bacterium]|nr:arabinosyltransferase [Acidimicrobiia bacterium]